MKEKLIQSYIEELEGLVLKNLERNKVDKLLAEMEENKKKKYFSFISEVNFSCLGKVNMKADKCESRMEKQKGKFRSIIGEISEFENRPISDELAQGFYKISRRLFQSAVEFGYTEEASELLKILKNPKLVKDYASKKVDDEILDIVRAYAKRVVLERTPDLEDQVDCFMIDVLTTEDYGTQTGLTMDRMLEEYENTEVKVGDVSLKVGQTPNFTRPVYAKDTKTK